MIRLTRLALIMPRNDRRIAALPRDPRADEYPMPPVPHGWYALMRSSELPRAKVVPLHYFGRALIAFRGPDGQPAVRTA